jgi:hypothetical protein
MLTFKSSSFFNEEYFPITVTRMSLENSAWSTRPTYPKDYHNHEFSEIAVTAQGEIDHYYNSQKTRLKRGDFFLIHPGALHTYSNKSSDFVLYNLLYDSTIPIPMLIMSNMAFLHWVYPVWDSNQKPFNEVFSHLPNKVLDEVIGTMEKIDREVKARKPGHHILITSLFTEIVLNLARHYPDDRSGEPKWALTKVVGFMKCHYAENLSVETLAKVAGMSESTLFRKFNSMLGMVRRNIWWNCGSDKPYPC